jgi:tetratricopeptide (TPR) repeat protein
MPDAQSCSTAGESLLEYAYGELAGAKLREVEDHLARCAACREELDRIALTRRAMGALPAEPAPGQGLESLLAYAEQAAARAREARPARWRWLGPVFSAGGLLAAAAVVFSVASPQRAPQRSADLLPAPASQAAAEGAEPPGEPGPGGPGYALAPAAPKSPTRFKAEGAPAKAATARRLKERPAPAVAEASGGPAGGPLAAGASAEGASVPRSGAEGKAPGSSADGFAARSLLSREPGAGGGVFYRASTEMQAAEKKRADASPAMPPLPRAALAPAASAPARAEPEAVSAESAPAPAKAALRQGELEREGDRAAGSLDRLAQALAEARGTGREPTLLAQLGYGQAAVGRAEDSLATFAQFLDRYPRHPRAPEVLLARIRLLERLQRREEARAGREELLQRYPESAEARSQTSRGAAPAPRGN